MVDFCNRMKRWVHNFILFVQVDFDLLGEELFVFVVLHITFVDLSSNRIHLLLDLLDL